jgi:hypothetical protein
VPEVEVLVAQLQCVLDHARVALELGRVDLLKDEAELALRLAPGGCVGSQQTLHTQSCPAARRRVSAICSMRPLPLLAVGITFPKLARFP